MENYNRFPLDNIAQIWLNVFDKLDERDKSVFSRTTPEWHDWADSKRTQHLITEVTPILLETLPKKNLLQTRQLCQSWTKELDHQIQTHDLNTRLYFEIAKIEGSTIPRLRNSFRNIEQIQSFAGELMTHPGNPFPGRNIEFNCDFSIENHLDGRVWNDVWREYWINMNLFLDTFGSQVHYATIQFDYGLEEPGEQIELEVHIRDCLVRLPNLRKLVILCMNIRNLGENETREYCRLNPLPRLQHLETFRIEEATPAMTNEILNACCVPANIKRLCFSYFSSSGRLCEAVYGFVNLEALEAPVSIQDLERLCRLERTPPLKALDLMFDDDEQNRPCVTQVFWLLEAFAESLIQFRARACLHARNPLGDVLGWNLPNLVRLSLDWLLGEPPVDLFQFKLVTHLTIYTVTDHNGENRSGFEERMNSSDIWKLMPSLKKLCMGRVTYNNQIMETPDAYGWNPEPLV